MNFLFILMILYHNLLLFHHTSLIFITLFYLYNQPLLIFSILILEKNEKKPQNENIL